MDFYFSMLYQANVEKKKGELKNSFPLLFNSFPLFWHCQQWQVFIYQKIRSIDCATPQKTIAIFVFSMFFYLRRSELMMGAQLI